MKILDALSLRHRIIFVILAVTIPIVGLGLGFVMFKDVKTFKQIMLDGAVIMAQTVGGYAASDLSFEDEIAAEETLSGLLDIPAIENAFLYNQQGKLFARLHDTPAPVPSALSGANNIAEFRDNYLHVIKPVRYQEHEYGSIYLLLSTQELDDKLQQYELFLLLAAVILIVLAYLLANALQSVISRPILTLADAAKDIAQSMDYSQRVEHESSDELGRLYAAFNQMLTRIQQQSQARDEADRGREHSEERLKRFFQATCEGVFFHEKGKILDVNPGMKAILGYDPEEVIGRNVLEFIEPASQATVLEKIRTDSKAAYEVELIARNGAIVPVELRGRTAQFEDHMVRTVSVHDISERRRAAQALQQAHDKLEEKVAERTQALAQANSSLIQEVEERKKAELIANNANRAKSTFLANMSHELRTPLNAIMGMGHLVQNTELTPRQADYINKIQSASRSLLGVIDDILDFSKIEAGQLKMERAPFLLEEVFDNLSNLAAMRAAEKGIEIIYAINKDVPQALLGDSLRLGQVLINLTSNAIKFTEHGQIIVSVALRQQDDDRVILDFSVQDSGIGIEPEQVAHLFEPFTQADGSTTRKYGGTGLGLTISKQLVTLMGGEMTAKSEPGQGSTFFFSAEFGRVQESTTKPPSPPADLRGTRVLVVDDNATARQIFEEMLESFAFQVTAVASGTAALAELERNNRASEPAYDLILMDWKMPEMDGLEATRIIRQSTWLPKLPTIIMITAYGREEIMQSAKQVGIEGFLVKPVNPSSLFNTLIETLSPTTRDKSIANVSAPNSVPHWHGIKVLVVEDNPINQQVAKELLENAHIEVSLADNGALAVQAVRENQFDLVLMDIQMPGLDGHQATRMIRQDAHVKHLPIIAMTAHAMVGDREKCLASGMDDHLPKPIDPTALYQILAQWLPTPTGHDEKPLKITPTPLPKTLPGIDIAKGLARSGENPALFRKLLLEFGQNHHNDDSLLATALHRQNKTQARQLLHTLRGIAGNIGAESLEQKANAIEQALINNTSYVELLIPFAGEFRIVMDGLKAGKI